ncbi:MAG: hypothetical protein IKR85_00690 [Clostridia bacterium]|nr:hypothetical protein [Clostridia bacterium]
MLYSLLLRPEANGRIQEAMSVPLLNELRIILSVFGVQSAIHTRSVYGVQAFEFECAALSDSAVKALSAYSHILWLCERTKAGYIPLTGAAHARIGADLPLILKYKGKTNEYFTQLLINLALCASDRRGEERLTLFDPMCGRGTTLFLALNRGWDACGIDSGKTEIAEADAYFKKYLETARISYTRSAQSQTLDAHSHAPVVTYETQSLTLRIAHAQAEKCDRVYNRRRAQLIVSDLPYGIQTAPGGMKRFEDMLRAMMPAWTRSLAPGGAMALSFNTYTLKTETVRSIMRENGLEVMCGGAWDAFAHRVEQAINRDAAVCRKIGG